MSTAPAAPLVVAGAGHMGGALAKAWAASGLASRLVLADPAPLPDAAAAVTSGGGRIVADLSRAPRPAAAVVLAVKPQVMSAVLSDAAALAGPDTLFLSIAAGTRLTTLERGLGGATAIVRAMPNTPAAIGQGISVLCANAHVSDAQRALATDLMRAGGATAWVADERLLDPVTAVSGSGPAYVFLLAEAMTEAGVAQGLPRDLAAQLARATVSGAGALLGASAEPASDLRRAVTSPGGTTEAALQVLMADPGMAGLLGQAIAAATARARSLSA